MENVTLFVQLAASALFIVQGSLVLIRCFFHHRWDNAFLLAVSLMLWGVYPLLSDLDWPHEVSLLAAMGTTGSFLTRATGKRHAAAWTGWGLAFLSILLFAEGMEYRISLPFQALRAFGIAAMGFACLALLMRLWRSSRSVPLLLALMASALWMSCALVYREMRLVGPVPPFDIPAVLFLLLSLCTGWLVFQEGYPERSGWKGALRGITSSEEQIPILRARLLALENALARQDRLVAAGAVAAGAAHEFKNVLSTIRVSAAYGLGQLSIMEKDRALALVVENTQCARDSAVDALERLAAEGRESTRSMDAALDLDACLRREKAALRAVGIVLETGFAEKVLFTARPGDVEQVLHNLVHNAAQAYAGPAEGSIRERVIRITARRAGEYAVIEVSDAAGGVSKDRRRELFAPGCSGSESTGLGLYLSRNLAQANGGTVEYEPTDGGSIFRLVLPAEVDEGGE